VRGGGAWLAAGAAVAAAGCGEDGPTPGTASPTGAAAGKADGVVTDGDAAVTSGLSADQAQLVLNILDDHCGDSWCEGEYDIHFKKIVCHFDERQSCTLTMTFEGYSGSGPGPFYWRSCKMPGLSDFEALVQTFDNGFQDATDGLITDVNDCVDRIEGNFPPQS
jgi:hypothetical protein